MKLPELFREIPPHASVASALDYAIDVLKAVSNTVPKDTQEQLQIKHHLTQTCLILDSFRNMHQKIEDKNK